MKAIFFESHGGIEVLKYAEIPEPKPKPGEALIKVRAVALNHLDIWVRRGWEGLHLKMPHITGSDIVGEIVAVNADSIWKSGTRVMINPGIVVGEDEWTRRGEESVSPLYKLIGEQVAGGLAEYVTVPIANVFKAPDGVPDEQVAAPILVGTTCWRMLTKRAALRPGETVLVVGSGGGVNSLAITFAKNMGATVFALAGSKEKAQRAEALGASFVINYKENRNWHVEVLKMTKGHGADIVIDNVGEETIGKSLRAVARGGRIVTVGNTSGYDVSFDNRLVFAKQISIIGSTMGSKQDFIDAMQFMTRHEIRPIIDRVEALKDGIKMIKHLEEGKQFGKIVLKP
jgi:NADPH:quinone reductase-like Zn-dependent oxidoreductase